MKPLPFKIPHGSKESIKVDHDRMAHFYDTYHTHEEIQLILIIKGHGAVYIGDKIIEFDAGDLYLLGPNLPHVFKDHESTNKGIESISIFFRPEFMGEGFINLPESRPISSLIDKSERGIRLSRSNNGLTNKMVYKVLRSNGMSRLTALIDLLDKLARINQLEEISSPGYQKPRRNEDGKRINDVFDYLSNNYHQDISLSQVANVAHMSSTAFCRYFKQHTRKTYSRFLNEIRVGQACKLLMESKLPVTEICYQVGFNNLSNFNRQFKRITGFTPTEFQTQHQ